MQGLTRCCVETCSRTPDTYSGRFRRVANSAQAICYPCYRNQERAAEIAQGIDVAKREADKLMAKKSPAEQAAIIKQRQDKAAFAKARKEVCTCYSFIFSLF